jgi:hypothetical protein
MIAKESQFENKVLREAVYPLETSPKNLIACMDPIIPNIPLAA